MESWQTILLSLILGSSSGGFLSYYISEKIKSKIQHEYNLKFENAKKELEKKATKFQIQYSKLHLDRADKLKSIYEMLIKVENSLKHYTHIGQGANWKEDKSRKENAQKDLTNLKEEILKNRIYFEEKFCTKIEEIITTAEEIIFEMSIAQDDGENESLENSKNSQTPLQKWFEAGRRTDNDLVNQRKLIEIEFRKILGISDI